MHVRGPRFVGQRGKASPSRVRLYPSLRQMDLDRVAAAHCHTNDIEYGTRKLALAALVDEFVEESAP